MRHHLPERRVGHQEGRSCTDAASRSTRLSAVGFRVVGARRDVRGDLVGRADYRIEALELVAAVYERILPGLALQVDSLTADSLTNPPGFMPDGFNGPVFSSNATESLRRRDSTFASARGGDTTGTPNPITVLVAEELADRPYGRDKRSASVRSPIGLLPLAFSAWSLSTIPGNFGRS